VTQKRAADVKPLMEDEELGRLIAGRNAPSVLAKEQLFERIYVLFTQAFVPAQLVNCRVVLMCFQELVCFVAHMKQFQMLAIEAKKQRDDFRQKDDHRAVVTAEGK